MQPNPPNNFPPPQGGNGQEYGPQYGLPYGQQEPQYGMPYGQNEQTTPDMYGQAGTPYQGDPTAAQPSAVPYAGQASAPPYQPSSPAPYQPTEYGSAMPDQGAPLGPPQSSEPKKKFSYLPLILMSIALVLVIGGVVAIIVVRESGNQARQTAEAQRSAAAASSKAPVPDCMVGSFKQVEYAKDVPLDDAGVGTVHLKGPKKDSGVELKITKDGQFTEVWDDVIYEGKSKDGQLVRARLVGEFKYKVRTEGGKLIKDQPEGDGSAYIDVDGQPKIKIPLRPTGGETDYACEGDDAFSFSGDDDFYTKYERVED